MHSDIRLGDVVEFTLDVSVDGKRQCFGRVVAKVAPSSVSRIFSSRQDYYVIKPEGGDVEEDEPAINLMMSLMRDAELEWGEVPKSPYVPLPEHMLSQLFGPAAAARFKENGLCPRCGDVGYWKGQACWCSYGHGMFI